MLHFPPILRRKTTLYKFQFVLLYTNRHLKRVFTEKSKFFPFRLDPYSKGSKNNIDIVVSLENVTIRLTLWAKSADDKLTIFFLSLTENSFVKAYLHGKKYFKMSSAENPQSIHIQVHSSDQLGFSTCRTFPVCHPVTSYSNALFMVAFSASLNFTTNHHACHKYTIISQF